MMRGSLSWRVWRAPVAISALTLLGLASALWGEHLAWKALCWFALATPVVVALWFAWPRKTP